MENSEKNLAEIAFFANYYDFTIIILFADNFPFLHNLSL